MHKAKEKHLRAAGWRTGSTADFLQLTQEEASLVEIKLSLSAELRQVRHRSHLTQSALAKRLGSSQSRIAKMEAGDPSVSLDLLVRALLATGTSLRDIGGAIGTRRRRAAG